MTEKVRLVIWDLDDTFWKGTVTEGGIQEYVQAHHDLVIELARRGIMSSICSKNDAATILPILDAKGILPYFIFPSISWEPKGMRLAQLVETVQLRARTVMFIDDNPGNRAEAAALVPGLQVEDETFIPRMLADPRFAGKDDAGLTRLNQYKLLEARKSDEARAAGGNEEFLRGCDIRVHIDYDVEAHIDRAIELINRTNQLNYTKKRLPEDPEAARGELRKQMGAFDRVSGLVRVADRYGDYGFVGFFMTGGMTRTMIDGPDTSNMVHFCFSCRTLGMCIERWLYDYLRRPGLKVVGEVLTDLSAPQAVDWVRLVPSMDDQVADQAHVASHIVLYGGCEANAIGVYLNAYTGSIDIHGNYVAGGLFVMINFADALLDFCDRDAREIAPELERLGLPVAPESRDLFATSPPGTLFVVNLALDAQDAVRFRHRVHDWTFRFYPNEPGMSLIDDAGDTVFAERLTSSRFTTDQRDQLMRARRHVAEHYELVKQPNEAQIIDTMREIASRVPLGSKLVIIADHDHVRAPGVGSELQYMSDVGRYNEIMRRLVKDYLYTGFVSFSDVLVNADEVMHANHYQRAVYLRMARRIATVAEGLAPRPDAPLSRRRLTRLAVERRVRALREAEARDLVKATYETLFRRQPDQRAWEGFTRDLVQGRLTPAGFIQVITGGREFNEKWVDPERQKELIQA